MTKPTTNEQAAYNGTATSETALCSGERRLRLARGTSPELLSASLEVRRATYVVETGKLREEGLVDAYDYGAEHIVLFTGSRAIGAARILGGTRTFEMETVFDITTLRQAGVCVEVSRFCVHPEFRHGRTILRLMAGVYEYALESGADTIVAATTSELLPLYVGLGFQTFQGPVLYPALGLPHTAIFLPVKGAIASLVRIRHAASGAILCGVSGA